MSARERERGGISFHKANCRIRDKTQNSPDKHIYADLQPSIKKGENVIINLISMYIVYTCTCKCVSDRINI